MLFAHHSKLPILRFQLSPPALFSHACFPPPGFFYMLMYSPNGKAVFPLPHIASSNKSAIFLVHLTPYGNTLWWKKKQEGYGGEGKGQRTEEGRKWFAKKPEMKKKKPLTWQERFEKIEQVFNTQKKNSHPWFAEPQWHFLSSTY